MATRSRAHAAVEITADLVILTVRNRRLQVLLVERDNEPFRGQLALPGGFLRGEESLEQAAARELEEETGLTAASLHLEQLRAYSVVDRDPRGRVITVAFLAIAPDLPPPVAGSDAGATMWRPVNSALRQRLAFDHARILRDGLEQARAKLEFTTIATSFCQEPFTVADLRQIYEAVWGTTLDAGNFSRKVTNTKDFLRPTGAKRRSDLGRPAELYRRGRATTLSPPLLRPDRS